jgi:vacuolar iron transporter family protein
MLDAQLKEQVLLAQKNEITEFHVYHKLARVINKEKQSEILEKISQEELAHYKFFKNITQQDVPPDKAKILIFVLMSKFLGLNFGLRLMEKGENLTQEAYGQLLQISPGVKKIVAEEKEHETELLNLIDEERLKYISSIVLGLNDALVELTATLAGFTLALQNTKLIGMVGLITGISAAMSMSAAEYLSVKHEESEEHKNPLKASVFTGLTYLATVALLVLPYFFLSNVFVCLSLALGSALLIILVFTFYISVAKDLNFKARFWEMAFLSLGIAAVTFVIGLLLKQFVGVSI